MSTAPADGVVDALGRVHGTSNVSCIGGASFAGSGAVHPTLTMVALALRTGEHLLEALR